MMNMLLITSGAFALFLLCPRMAGMTNLIATSTKTNLVQVSTLGTILSLPLIVLMVFIYKWLGLWGALAFSVLTDFGAALLMKQISLKAGLETLIIALFLILGVRVASFVSGFFP